MSKNSLERLKDILEEEYKMYQKEIDIVTKKYTVHLKTGKPVSRAVLVVPVWITKLQESEKQTIKSFTLQTELELYDADYNFLSVTVLIDKNTDIVKVYDDYGDFEAVSALDDYFFCCIQQSINLKK